MGISERIIRDVGFEGLGNSRGRDELPLLRPALDPGCRLDPYRIVGGTEALVGYNVADDVRESVRHAGENAQVGGAPVGTTNADVRKAVKEGRIFVTQGVVLGR